MPLVLQALCESPEYFDTHVRQGRAGSYNTGAFKQGLLRDGSKRRAHWGQTTQIAAGPQPRSILLNVDRTAQLSAAKTAVSDAVDRAEEMRVRLAHATAHRKEIMKVLTQIKRKSSSIRKKTNALEVRPGHTRPRLAVERCLGVGGGGAMT